MGLKEEKSRGRRKEIVGVALLALFVFTLLSLISYSPQDPTLYDYDHVQKVANWGGIVGSSLGALLFVLIGLSSYILPILILILALEFLSKREIPIRVSIPISLLLLLVSSSGLLSIYGDDPLKGGIVGMHTTYIVKGYLNRAGAIILFTALLIISIIHATGISIVGMTTRLYNLGVDMSHRVRTSWMIKRQRQKRHRELETEVETKKSAPTIVTPAPSKKQVKAQEPHQEHFDFLKPTGAFQLPPLSFLDPASEKGSSLDKEVLLANSKMLEKKLQDFGVEGQVVEVRPGPVVTMYEFEPAPGVKVGQVVALTDDLSLAFRATSVRILAPVPGKAVVGIEVPNPTRERINLRETLECQAFTKSHSSLTLALGKDISGNPFVTDLSKMPHLLMAGATGAGKSVSVNVMILSILYKATPEDVRFLMIDPKMLELSAYDGIPHLLVPVVTDAKRAAPVLKGVIREMEERYRLMAEPGAKSIDRYNHLLKEKNLGGEHRKLPYIVVVIDELADLMMTSGKDVEELLVKLSQMARASGIHLIVATQRPSVDVITGLIKANFPARVSFQVSSRTDSRTILDANGAEDLLGEGDMLFLPPGSSKLQRVHGAYVSDVEIKRVTEFLKKQGKPRYDKDIAEARVEKEEEREEEFREEFERRYEEAVKLVMEMEQASISYIQRRLRIGYNTAARIVERMEEEGILGPSQGSRPREVLVRRGR
ncbi:MAG: DNA translocase FtsK 4TM domain-containing protein [Deltaproteobacteria bacterium]|nr:DNA translocase FtsK 4TM domain-containing protein [Deltaproteobacteria bacterium]